MPQISMSRATANRHVKCSLCSSIVRAGEIFWRAFDDSNTDILWICTNHIPLNSVGMTTEEATEEQPFQVIRPQFLDVQRNVIPRIVADWDSVFEIGDEQFEELVCDRLLSMGLQAFRTGRSNRKDGGIDIVFWTSAPMRVLGAVQVKHHRSPKSLTGPAVAREFAGVMAAHRFNVGLIVTNTAFTEDARKFVQNHSPIVQLRDGADVMRWIVDDYCGETWNTVSSTVELSSGVEVQFPRFL